MEKLWRSPVAAHRIRLNRGDVGFGHEAIMAWHEEDGARPDFLFKLKLSANVKRAIAAICPDQWQGRPGEGLVQIAETTLKLHGWSRGRRVVVERRLKPLPPTAQGCFWEQGVEEFRAYVTSLDASQADASNNGWPQLRRS